MVSARGMLCALWRVLSSMSIEMRVAGTPFLLTFFAFRFLTPLAPEPLFEP